MLIGLDKILEHNKLFIGMNMKLETICVKRGISFKSIKDVTMQCHTSFSCFLAVTESPVTSSSPFYFLLSSSILSMLSSPPSSSFYFLLFPLLNLSLLLLTLSSPSPKICIYLEDFLKAL